MSLAAAVDGSLPLPPAVQELHRLPPPADRATRQVAEQQFIALLDELLPGRLLLGAALDGGDNEVWIVDLTSGVHSQLAMGVPNMLAEWSASGSEVLAASWRQSERDHGIWGRPADASAEPTRRREGFLRTWVQEGVETTDYMEFIGLHAHADGESFAFTLNAGTNPVQPNWDIYIGRLGGDTTLVPFAAGDADEVAARF